jgi:hypothetical protein
MLDLNDVLSSNFFNFHRQFMGSFTSPIRTGEVALPSAKKTHAWTQSLSGRWPVVGCCPNRGDCHLTPTVYALERTRELVASLPECVVVQPRGEAGRQAGVDRSVQVANDFMMLEEITAIERPASVV